MDCITKTSSSQLFFSDWDSSALKCTVASHKYLHFFFFLAKNEIIFIKAQPIPFSTTLMPTFKPPQYEFWVGSAMWLCLLQSPACPPNDMSWLCHGETHDGADYWCQLPLMLWAGEERDLCPSLAEGDGLVSLHCPGLFRASLALGGSKIMFAMCKSHIQTDISPSTFWTVLSVSSVLPLFSCSTTAPSHKPKDED